MCSSLILTVEENPVNITVEINSLEVTFTPDTDWIGTEEIIFTVTDDSLASASDNVVVAVISDLLLSPTNLNITIVGETVQLQWDPVPGATEYLVFSSDDPYSGFELDETGTFTGTIWTCPFTEQRKFFKVVAKN